MKIRVLIADSSEEVCKVIESIINNQKNMQVVGIANDPFQAREMIKTLVPDVLTLAIEFPRMNGILFLDKLMKLRPIPVVMISTLLDEQSLITEKAIKMGATACICKPSIDQLELIASDIINSVREAPNQFKQRDLSQLQQMPLTAGTETATRDDSDKYLIAIGASTGGTEAITKLLTRMPTNCPGIVITQHMSKSFTGSFAARLAGLCAINVAEATHNTLIKAGNAYVAPGDQHLLVQKRSGCYYSMLSDAEPVNLHRPSIDILFESVADSCKGFGVGIILTGMGKDGAAGLLKMKQAGAETIAQDEASCVVYGMPKEAVKLVAAKHQLPLGRITDATLNYINSRRKK
ncbi:protein-glutamate methylesterase/protein-glutamine glutaminase [Shewanella youngdeokensis]|uniref:Protein-glutamate methylesterase/protein-glutamine glutaminase n=1 Tax=Shewanella youngdeokensis TaxID=2999068 RepID=A0ABZ0K0Y2_9GAMM|nr:chemotaxis response regulator protein-glutamate methylesterase [Shewanella sp. DAU334]